MHFLLPLTFDGPQNTFCFSFLLDKGRWYWQHVESIVIRLDQLASLPATEFPDLPEAKKAWMREEILVSEQVRLFNWFAPERSKSFACDMFRDGRGYALTAKAWIPFVAPSRAFILYVCWEQAKLRGNPVKLLELEDREALVEIESTFLKLYHQTGHLRHQIHWEDYRMLFETIWQDRASHAGWKLETTYDGDTCRLHFTSSPVSRPDRAWTNARSDNGLIHYPTKHISTSTCSASGSAGRSNRSIVGVSGA